MQNTQFPPPAESQAVRMKPSQIWPLRYDYAKSAKENKCFRPSPFITIYQPYISPIQTLYMYVYIYNYIYIYIYMYVFPLFLHPCMIGLQFVGAFSCVPVQESLPAEHGCEVLRHALEHLLERNRVVEASTTSR